MVFFKQYIFMHTYIYRFKFKRISKWNTQRFN